MHCQCSYYPEHDAGGKYGAEDGDKKEHHGGAADILNRKESTDTSSDNGDYNIESQHLAVGHETLCEQRGDNSDQPPYNPYKNSNLFR